MLVHVLCGEAQARPVRDLGCLAPWWQRDRREAPLPVFFRSRTRVVGKQTVVVRYRHLATPYVLGQAMELARRRGLFRASALTFLALLQRVPGATIRAARLDPAAQLLGPPQGS